MQLQPSCKATLQLQPSCKATLQLSQTYVAGYFISTLSGLGVAHFPERKTEAEIDFILTVGDQRIPVEIKYQNKIEFADTDILSGSWI